MKVKNLGRVILCGLCTQLLALAGCQQMTFRRVKSPPTDNTNSFYVSNSPPLAPSPLIKLPIGSIKAKGWLGHMLELEADGMIGHLPELSRWCKAEGNAWLSPEGEGQNGWEELPYWLKGYGDLGYVLGDERIIKEARIWIEGILSSQRADGWFGPRLNLTKQGGKPDLWPNMIAMNCLQSYYEYTGDKRVLDLMTRYFRWQLSVPSEDFLPKSWQKRRAGDNLESVYWLYNRTGEKWLLDVAKKVHEHTSDWMNKVASWHGVNIAQCFRQPAVYYVQAKDPKFIAAAERNYDEVMGLYGQVPGGMFGADENCRKGYTGPRQAAETCSMVEFMHSFEMLTKITGNPLWADRCEQIAFNSYPASRPPDLKGLHYLTAPNMIQLDRHNKSPGVQNSGCMLAYTPWIYRCCQHNISHGWPYYAEELWLATPDNGLCASLYSACEVTAKVGNGTTVTIVEQTDYPFRETIVFTISTSKPVRFPLYLRIPRWCEGAKIAVNGAAIESAFGPLSYAVIERRWTDGDKVEVEFPARITVDVWEKNKNSVSVNRGPLTFSLKIGEKWVAYEGKSRKIDKWVESDGSIKWPAHELYPTTAWNYGLVVDVAHPEKTIEAVKEVGPIAEQPFTPNTSPIELWAKARKIPEWKMDELGLVGKLPQSPVQLDEHIGMLPTVPLIPMGAARLRISAFPTIKARGEPK
ncbi:MAG: beta-L-arabinofuranosidase domain-containing protein [Planctomycetota bacterium]